MCAQLFCCGGVHYYPLVFCDTAASTTADNSKPVLKKRVLCVLLRRFCFLFGFLYSYEV